MNFLLRAYQARIHSLSCFEPFFALHGQQSGWRLLSSFVPPRDTGMMWSTLILYVLPQITHGIAQNLRSTLNDSCFLFGTRRASGQGIALRIVRQSKPVGWRSKLSKRCANSDGQSSRVLAHKSAGCSPPKKRASAQRRVFAFSPYGSFACFARSSAKRARPLNWGFTSNCVPAASYATFVHLSCLPPDFEGERFVSVVPSMRHLNCCGLRFLGGVMRFEMRGLVATPAMAIHIGLRLTIGSLFRLGHSQGVRAPAFTAGDPKWIPAPHLFTSELVRPNDRAINHGKTTAAPMAASSRSFAPSGVCVSAFCRH